MLARRAVLALACLLPLAGCASKDAAVSTTFDPLARFPAQATYAWDDAATRLPTDPRVAELDLGPLIQETVEEAFAAHGYRRVIGGSPDYRLSYELAVHNWIAADASKSIGSLSLLLVEAKSGRRVWLGFGRAELHVGRTRDERKVRLHEALARMLEKFPPSQRGE
jgi:hypothetical protein